MNWIRKALALAFLALFAIAWIWIGWKLWHFKPSQAHKTLDLDNDLVNIAGFLSSAVAAGTAAVLGIEIKKPPEAPAAGTAVTEPSLASRVETAASSSPLTIVGIVVYAAVAIFVAVVWIGHTKEAPDMIRTFSWGVVGWLAGSFAAVFRES